MEENLNKDLDEAKAKAEEYLAGWKRERADFLNHKKEEGERMAGMLDYAKRESVLRVLPIIDTMELAEKTMPQELRENEWSKGFMQIQKQVEEFLRGQGIEQVKALGEPFDPNYMEAIEAASAEASAGQGGEESPSGTVVQEFQKGYTLNGKLIRPAKVKITK